MSLRSLLDQQAKHFEEGGKLEKLHALWEAGDTILYTPGKVTTGPSHVRDGLDLKRMMMTVVWALVPAILMALYNTGYQAHLAISKGAAPAGSLADQRHGGDGSGLRPGKPVGLHGAWRALLLPGADRDLRGWRLLGSPLLLDSQARGRRGFLRYRLSLPAHSAGDDSSLAGGDRDQLRRRAGQGDLRRHRNELPQPGTARPGLPVLRLSDRDLRRCSLDRRQDRR